MRPHIKSSALKKPKSLVPTVTVNFQMALKLVVFFLGHFILLTLPISAQSYECVYYDRSSLLSPCSVYNPSSWAYLDTSTQTLSGMINFNNALIEGIKAF